MAEETLKQLSLSLTDCYTKLSVRNALRVAQMPVPGRDSPIVESALSNQKHLSFYHDPTAIEITLDTIDLPRIYMGVDEREKKEQNLLGYEDNLVLETLNYFKNDFFKWINAPPCPKCHLDGENMESLGAGRPSSPGPHLIGVVERYRCRTCNEETTFARMNNPVSLLESRKGRCGEWVNCFLLVLKAVLGTDSQLRYIWNYEDHVWCEYYSRALQRWVSLDPCENAWDQPSLYCDNWGKKMSWVIGIGTDYIVDLLSKYITSPEKQIPKSLVADEKLIDLSFRRINARLAEKLWQSILNTSSSEEDARGKFYKGYLLIKGKEAASLNPSNVRLRPSETSSEDSAQRKGRQTGSAAWIAGRGEDGNH